jgi:uncharacterized protein with GYD domain
VSRPDEQPADLHGGFAEADYLTYLRHTRLEAAEGGFVALSAVVNVGFVGGSYSTPNGDVRVDERHGGTMPLYLSRFSYTPETWARLIGNPEDRRKAAQSYIESVGGTLHGFWYAFGSHDGYNLWEAPDNVSMAAVALAISGGGALSSLETTVLLTVDETMDALRKAAQVQYQAPGA